MYSSGNPNKDNLYLNLKGKQVWVDTKMFEIVEGGI